MARVKNRPNRMPGHRQTEARHGGTASHRRSPRKTTTTRVRPVSCGELFPALEPTSAKHFAALGCRHALAEAVFFAALALLGLIGHLSHMGFPPLSSKQTALYRVEAGCVNQAQISPRPRFLPVAGPGTPAAVFTILHIPSTLLPSKVGILHARRTTRTETYRRTARPRSPVLLFNSSIRQPSHVWWRERVVFFRMPAPGSR